ncbi:MAG: efflux RND transporter periplasmic adaptor subunit [Phycisphaerae bacterium]|jgi:multidrug resistance efflux pump
MRRQIILSFVLVIALLAAGVLSLGYLVRTRPAPPTADTARPPLVVQAIALQPQTKIEPIVGYGTARADRQAWIAAQVAGQVVFAADRLKSGQAVVEGDVLLRVDDRDYQAARDRARSRLTAETAALAQCDVEEGNLAALESIATEEFAVAERELTRIRDLLEQGNSSERELDQARLIFEQARRELRTLRNQQALLPERRAQQQAACDLARADLDLADVNLQRCTVTAPFAGRLDAVGVERGEHVVPGQRLFLLVDPRRIEVPVELPVSQHDRIACGAPVQLTLDSRRDAFWQGRVARAAPLADELTRTFPVFVEVDNATQRQPLIPGTFVQACIDGPEHDDVLLVPRGCIQDERVFIYHNGCARQRPIHVERHLLDETVVTGLHPGDVVITSNLDALYDGAPVEVLLAGASPTSRPAFAGRVPTTQPQAHSMSTP